MNKKGKKNALAELKKLQPRGGTNIWGAIQTALDMMNSRDEKSNNPSIVLLTDGCPNQSPPGGEVKVLE